ncbi:MAG: hypothetical protein AAF687_07655 [Pseudomonadota bacterium]
MRRRLAIALCIAAPFAPPFALASAQERVPVDIDPIEADDGPVVIDILAPPPESEQPSEAEIKACEDEMEAAVVSKEIIVCGRLGGDPSYWYSGGREAWLKRYAAETAYDDELVPPDVAGAGIFRGPATIGGLCFIPPCPKDPALIIDVEALPDAPEGSDADRIARGLAPLEVDDESAEQDRARMREALGLPPPRSDEASEP